MAAEPRDVRHLLAGGRRARRRPHRRLHPLERAERRGDLIDPSGWQSGLHRFDGRPKPLAAAFPNPIFASRTARRATVWGQVRTATTATAVQLERRTSAGWRPYKAITTDVRGAFVVRVPRRSSAAYRYTYVSPVDGTTRTSTATRARQVR